VDLIDWICDTCHKPTNGVGAISITYADIHRADAIRRATPGGDAFANLTVADALAQPQLGLWKVECNTCAGYCVGAYAIDIERARTVAELNWWTQHLSSKTWYPASNWTAVVASVGVTQPLRSVA
jgi:hypothetical protein